MADSMFDKLKFEHLAIADDYRDYLRKAAKDLDDPTAKGDAEITIKLKINNAGGGGVVITPSCAYKPPKLKRMSLAAFLDHEGDLVTQDARQNRLPFDNVTPLNVKEKSQ